MHFQNLSILLCEKTPLWVTPLLILGCKRSLKMLQTSFSLNELTLGLEEVEWGLVLVCTIGVHLFTKGNKLCVLMHFQNLSILFCANTHS